MLISVVIPTFQRPEALARCLECIGRQKLAQENFEVIVTDDSGDAESKTLVHEKFPRAQWTQGPQRGPAANRNYGASLARGEWIVFVDDDCEPAFGWLEAIAVQADVDVIEGKTVCPSDRDTPFEERVENLKGESFWSCNLAVRRSVFNRLGGFDEDFLEAGGEDMEFAWRIAKNKLHTRFVAGALVIHPARVLIWKQIWWRTWLMRWIVLFRVKTGQSPSLRASWFESLWWLVRVEILNLLRVTLHFFLKFDSKRWRTQAFQVGWKWLTFPLVLPYLMVWEIRFRNSLGNRAASIK
ncbi:MAG: glycosyltransferase family A protein [Chthoniobacteraceae bacterium]